MHSEHARRTRVAHGETPRDILLDQAEYDFDDSFEILRERLHHEKRGTSMAAVRTIEMVLMAAMKGLGVRKRLRRDVAHLLDLAERVHAGEDPEALAREHVDDLLRLNQMALFIRVKEPAFADVKERATRMFAKRLPDLARLATADHAGDYGSLVRHAFPDRAEAERIIEDNAEDVRALIAHAVAHPHLLRAIPDRWVPKAADLARDFIRWKIEQVRGDLDVYYGDTTDAS